MNIETKKIARAVATVGLVLSSSCAPSRSDDAPPPITINLPERCSELTNALVEKQISLSRKVREVSCKNPEGNISIFRQDIPLTQGEREIEARGKNPWRETIFKRE